MLSKIGRSVKHLIAWKRGILRVCDLCVDRDEDGAGVPWGVAEIRDVIPGKPENGSYSRKAVACCCQNAATNKEHKENQLLLFVNNFICSVIVFFRSSSCFSSATSAFSAVKCSF